MNLNRNRIYLFNGLVKKIPLSYFIFDKFIRNKTQNFSNFTNQSFDEMKIILLIFIELCYKLQHTKQN